MASVGGEVVMTGGSGGGGGGSVTPRGWSSAYAESVSMAQACVERRGDRRPAGVGAAPASALSR